MVEKEKKSKPKKPRKPRATQTQIVTVNVTAPAKAKRKRKSKAKRPVGFDPRAVGVSGPVGTINSGLTPVIHAPAQTNPLAPEKPKDSLLSYTDADKAILRQLLQNYQQQQPPTNPPPPKITGDPPASPPAPPTTPVASNPLLGAGMPEPPPLGRSETGISLDGSIKDLDKDALDPPAGKPEPLTRQDSGADEFSKEVERQRELQSPAGGDAVEGSQKPPPLTAQDRGGSDMSEVTMEEGFMQIPQKQSPEQKQKAKEVKAAAVAAKKEAAAVAAAAKKAAKQQKEDERAAALASKIRTGGGGQTIRRDF
jgi:hypothetical protein